MEAARPPTPMGLGGGAYSFDPLLTGAGKVSCGQLAMDQGAPRGTGRSTRSNRLHHRLEPVLKHDGGRNWPLLHHRQFTRYHALARSNRR